MDSESFLENFMTGSGESREEATDMRRDVLNIKMKIRIGF